MEELDEVSRRELLIKARQAIEKDYQQAEADKKALDTQIEAKRKELALIIERVEAAKLQSEQELKRMAVETVQERERIQAQNNTIKAELSQLQSARNKAETESNQSLDALTWKIDERRATLHDISNRVTLEEVKLKTCQAALAAIKQTLTKADL